MAKEDHEDVEPLTEDEVSDKKPKSSLSEDEWEDIEDYSEMVTLFVLLVVTLVVFILLVSGGIP